jgi:hypothetical protein
MMKQLLMTTAVSALLLATANAQSQPPASAPSTPPAATQTQDMKPADASKADALKPGATASASPAVVSSQSPDQFLASKFNGTDVIGADSKKVGDVSDVLFDKDGKILAYVVSIGGFLGIGSKNVAMAPASFQVVKGINGAADQLKVSMSQEQLKQMASFEPYQPPRAKATTTGSAPGGGGMGRPGGGTSR